MNANRALGLLAALLVTAGQAMVFAVDTAAARQPAAHTAHYDARHEAKGIPAGQLAYGGSRGLIGG